MIEGGKLIQDRGVRPLDPAIDRVTICASMGLHMDRRRSPEARGFTEGANSRPGAYVGERAFAERPLP